MQVSKWGNSLAVRLPAQVVELLELREGDDIEIDVVGARQFAVRRSTQQAQWLERLRAFRGRLPEDFHFDRQDASGRSP